MLVQDSTLCIKTNSRSTATRDGGHFVRLVHGSIKGSMVCVQSIYFKNTLCAILSIAATKVIRIPYLRRHSKTSKHFPRPPLISTTSHTHAPPPPTLHQLQQSPLPTRNKHTEGLKCASSSLDNAPTSHPPPSLPPSLTPPRLSCLPTPSYSFLLHPFSYHPLFLSLHPPFFLPSPFTLPSLLPPFVLASSLSSFSLFLQLLPSSAPPTRR